MEMFLKPEAPCFLRIWPFTDSWNKKRGLIIGYFPVVKAYYKNIEEHPMLAKYFRERAPDSELDF